MGTPDPLSKAIGFGVRGTCVMKAGEKSSHHSDVVFQQCGEDPCIQLADWSNCNQVGMKSPFVLLCSSFETTRAN